MISQPFLAVAHYSIAMHWRRRYGGSKWVPPQLPKDFAPPVNYRWPEYVTIPRGEEWWIPEGA